MNRFAALETASNLGHALARSLADLIARPRCAACDALVGRAVFCSPCAASVEVAPAVPDVVHAAAYGGAVAAAIKRLKYGRRSDLAAPLGELLRRALRDARARADVVVPVPLHARRLAERGFNQAALLASPVARELGARFAPRGLTRLRATREQAGLERAERLENVLGAFVATRRLDGARVALVDDVLTTGATLEAAATALHDAGASSVLYVVVGVASA